MKGNKKHIILKTEHLSIGYRSKSENHVVSKDINIALNEGELVGLVGGNGIGKSTMLRTLTNTQEALSGQVFINDKAVNTYGALELAQVLSIVFTEKLTSKNLSVFELVALGRQPYTNWIGTLSDLDLEKVTHALQLTNIESLKDKKCFELSDGQLQKVMISRALAQDTHLIILDEPTTHLDMYYKAYTLKLLQKLAKETGKTILFSSHEIDLAIQLCDKMIVMTPEHVVSDSPCNLIQQGVFSTLFPDDLIQFDASTGSFRVNK
ncbi:iron(III) ABC transporter, ATP-binding protein [Formosa agariphila KMM 3901]|uniref:Iron(III) ABC transporter, ATP-binding protein n=1 Tax=Formosa agariphila (strain DSM 15362 / KCTC 12365 / LMG 23005 / KMM 3901 / M-2Alg 35-1) TaxID=1347342 RepID=T2KLH8_FORAG|nr:ABC transporter ATP-binding protein [Formosa agariphila]CDF79757.1 iron(III) ABC transporter, ATP-binding protein [Formosa agariphila KMM 3901]